VSARADDSTVELKDAIRAYVGAHPGAADGVVGIHRWWLPPALAERSVAEVQSALDELVAERELTRTTMPDQRAVYSGVHRPSRGPLS